MPLCLGVKAHNNARPPGLLLLSDMPIPLHSCAAPHPTCSTPLPPPLPGPLPLPQALHPLFAASEAAGVRDNALGCVGRMVSADAGGASGGPAASAAGSGLPLEAVLPVFLSGLPLREDMKEAEAVYSALCGLVTGGGRARVGFETKVPPQVVWCSACPALPRFPAQLLPPRCGMAPWHLPARPPPAPHAPPPTPPPRRPASAAHCAARAADRRRLWRSCGAAAAAAAGRGGCPGGPHGCRAGAAVPAAHGAAGGGAAGRAAGGAGGSGSGCGDGTCGCRVMGRRTAPYSWTLGLIGFRSLHGVV